MAGAIPVAALLSDPGAFRGPVVAVLSGGNVDPLLIQRILTHGMVAAGRYLSLRLRLTDRPGALAAMLTTLSAADANVLDIQHVRTDPRLGLTEAEVELHLETKGPEHCEEVAAALRAMRLSGALLRVRFPARKPVVCRDVSRYGASPNTRCSPPRRAGNSTIRSGTHARQLGENVCQAPSTPKAW